MDVTVARIDRAQGLKGEVALTLRTDRPDLRLVPGANLTADSDRFPKLTVAQSRKYKDRWYVRFVEVDNRTDAESLRHVTLYVSVENSDEEDAWYPHELEGLRVELVDGTTVGTVIGLENYPAHDMLVIAERPGGRTLIPFVHQIVPIVDQTNGRVVIDPPAGLLERDVDQVVTASDLQAADDDH